MANNTRSGHSSGRRLDAGEGRSNSRPRKVDNSDIRRSTLVLSNGKIIPGPSITRRSERLEKRTRPESPLGPRKSMRLEQQNTPSPLRRSDRGKNQGSSTPFGSTSSEKVLNSVDRQKKREKKEKSAEQLTMESEKVLDKKDCRAAGLKMKQMSARRYKSLFKKQKVKIPPPDSDAKLDRPDMLPPINRLDSQESGSQLENGNLGFVLRVMDPLREESLKGSHSGSPSNIKDSDAMISGNDIEPELASSSQSLSDKPTGPSDGDDLDVSEIGCSNTESIDDANEVLKDHSCSGNEQIPELVVSTSAERGDIALESGNQYMQSERGSRTLSLQLDVGKIMVNEDMSSQVIEAAPLASAEHEKDKFIENGAVCSSQVLEAAPPTSDENEKDNFFGNGPVCSNNILVKLKDIVGSKSDSSKFVEYWVPVPLSNLQLEQYCATLLTHSITLCSSLKKDGVGALQDILMTVRKCCSHPYIVEPSLQEPFMKGLRQLDILNVGIKASGKLEFLDMVLSKIKRRKLKVLVLFRSIAGSGDISIGNILDDFMRQRFGRDSYERVDACLPPAKKQEAINKFDSKGGEQFVLLLEHRACSSSIKLSVDIVIIFDTEFNPANDIKDLQKMPIDSQSEQIKVFRLYSCHTLEEKALMLAKLHKNVHSFQSINRATSDILLMWGAADLFNKLDKYHAENSTVSSVDVSSGQQRLLDDIVRSFMAKIISGSRSNCEHDAIITNALIIDGVYHTDCQLLGEKDAEVTVGLGRQIFWKKLLEGRNPQWKFLGRPASRSRKRVHYDEGDEAATKHCKIGDSRDSAPCIEFELEEKGQPAVSKAVSAAIDQSVSLPLSVAYGIDKANRDINLLSEVNSCSHESEMACPAAVTPSDERSSLHTFLRAEMEKLCVVLKLSEDVTHLVGRFLEYVMENHHVNEEPASILQAFQMSLCWTAASILKERIDRTKSLSLAKQLLNFQCTEVEASSVYKKLRPLKSTFLQVPGNINVSIPSDHVTSEGTIEQPPCAAHPLSASLGPQNVRVEVKARSSSVEPSDLQTEDKVNGNYVDRKIKKIQRKCDKHMSKLHQNHLKEIAELKKVKEQEKLQLEGDYQLESAFIRTTYHQSAMRIEKLKILEEEFKKKMQDHENLMEKDLRELEARLSVVMEDERKKVSDWMAKMRSCIIQKKDVDELHISGFDHEMGSSEGGGHATCSGPQKGVPTTGPNVGEQSPDRSVDDNRARNAITSGISVSVEDDAVGSIVASKTLPTLLDPVSNKASEIEPTEAAPVTGVEEPKETNQSSHLIEEINVQEEVRCNLHTEMSSLMLNSVSRTDLDISVETSVVRIERLKEVTCLPDTVQDVTPNETTSIDFTTSEGKNAYESSASGQNKEIPSGVPGTVGSETGNTCTLKGTSVVSEAMGNQNNSSHSSIRQNVPSPQIPSKDLISVPIITTSGVSHERDEHCSDRESVDMQEDVAPDTQIQTTAVKFARSKALDAGCSAQSHSEPQATESSEQLELESIGIQHMEVPVAGNLTSTVSFTSSTQVDTGSTVNSNWKAQASENTRQLLPVSNCSSPGCGQLTAEASPQGHIEVANSVQISEASPLMVEESVELSREAVSQNAETIVLPSSTECIVTSHGHDSHDSHNDEISSLENTMASPRMVEASVELSNPAVSPNGEIVVLPPSREGVGSGDCDNLFDLPGVNGEPNNEFYTAYQNTVAPVHGFESTLPNQAPVPSGPNLVIPEGSTPLSGRQLRLTGDRPTLPFQAADPLQHELEKICKDIEQNNKADDNTRSLLETECEKEIEEIRRKYETKLTEAKSSFLLRKAELDLYHKKVSMNKLLAEVFQLKFLDQRGPGFSTMKQVASSFIQNRWPSRLENRPATTLASMGQHAASQQTAIPPLQSVHRPGLFPSIPARPPQISAITPSIGGLRVGGEIRAPAPHLQLFRPPASTSATSIPCHLNSPSQQSPPSLAPFSTSVSAQQPMLSLPVPFLLQQNPLPPPQPQPQPQPQPVTTSHSRINQDVFSSMPSENQNGAQPSRCPTLSAVELLMDIDNQAGGHLPNILQHLAGSGLNTNALNPSVSRTPGNANASLSTTTTAATSDVVCLSDDDC